MHSFGGFEIFILARFGLESTLTGNKMTMITASILVCISQAGHSRILITRRDTLVSLSKAYSTIVQFPSTETSFPKHRPLRIIPV